MKRTKTVLVGTTAVAAAAGVALAVLPAFAADGDGSSAHRSAGQGGSGSDLAVQSGSGGSGRGSASLFVASLNGANEVPVQGGPAVGDRDGAALQFVEVRGTKCRSR